MPTKGKPKPVPSMSMRSSKLAAMAANMAEEQESALGVDLNGLDALDAVVSASTNNDIATTSDKSPISVKLEDMFSVSEFEQQVDPSLEDEFEYLSRMPDDDGRSLVGENQPGTSGSPSNGDLTLSRVSPSQSQVSENTVCRLGVDV